MLLDTYGLVYRAFFALPPLTTTRGVSINAAYGFTQMLNKIVADESPSHIIAAFDKGMPAHRVALYQQYKAQRDQMPDDLRPQFALVRRILDVNRIPIVEIEGEEADDMIATLARQAEDAGQETVIVTGDTDLFQTGRSQDDDSDDAARYNGPWALRYPGGPRAVRRPFARAAARLPRTQRRSVG